MRRYVKGLKDIADLYKLKSGSDTSKKGEGLKILTNKQMLLTGLMDRIIYQKYKIILNI